MCRIVDNAININNVSSDLHVFELLLMSRCFDRIGIILLITGQLQFTQLAIYTLCIIETRKKYYSERHEFYAILERP